MKLSLLDTNLLIALLWPAHRHHAKAQSWFAETAREQWATCPFTQSGFVRIISNPAFSRDAVSPAEAVKLLAANVASPAHQFLPASLPMAEALLLLDATIAGHRQLTDAYLLALALHHQACLVTFDQSIVSLAGDRAANSLQVIGA